MSTENKAGSIKKLVKNIEGWLTDNEGEFLYETAKNCSGKGVIVEIGSWKGGSTICLGKGSKDGNNLRIYAIDPHTGSSEHKKWYGRVWTLDEFKENIKRAEVDDVVVPIVKTSEEAAKNWNKPVEFLFVDGAHEYIYVSLDYKLWEPHLVEGGIIAFHDTIAGSPKKVVDKYIYKSKKFKNVGFVYSISFGIKTNENSLIDRAKNSYVWLLRYIYTGLRAEIAIGKIRCKLKTKRRPKILYALITASQRIPIAMRIIAEAFQSKHSWNKMIIRYFKKPPTAV